MESFIYKNKEVSFSSVTGIVLGGQEKRSETHVSSSGGGGYVGKHGGHVSAPTIHSSVTTKHEFWIKLEDGTEKPIQLSGCDIPLKEGHKITLVSVNKSKRNYEFYTFLVNHNSKETYDIKTGDVINATFRFANVYPFTSVFLGVLTGIGASVVDQSWGPVGFFSFLMVVVFLITYSVNKQKEVIALINEHLAGLSKAVL